MMREKRIFLRGATLAFGLLLLVLLTAAPAAAETWSVYPDDDLVNTIENTAQAGDTIYIHAGTYNLTKSKQYVSIDKPDITLRGEDEKTTILNLSGTTGSLQIGYSGQAQNCTIEHLQFAVRGVFFRENASNGVIKDCIIKCPNGVAAAIQSPNCTAEDNIIDGCLYAVKIPKGVENTIIRDNRIYNATDKYYTIQVDGNNTLVENNTIQGSNAAGISIEYANNCTASGNTFDSCGYCGVELYDARENNRVYLNAIISCGKTVTTSGTTAPADMSWTSATPLSYTYDGTPHTGYIGNYYGDYTGTDADADGIGDTSYELSDGLGNDTAPLVATLDHYVITGGAPAVLIADFTATPTTGDAPLTVQFTDTSTGSPTGWAWDFGDNATSTDQNATHIYDTAGTYTVNLTVSNADGSDSEVKTGYINVDTVTSSSDWDQFQRNAEHNAVTDSAAPDKNPGIRWKYFTYATDAACGGCGIDVPPLVHGDHVYTFAANGSVWALNKTNGALVWKQNTTPGSLQTSTPAWGDGRLFVATASGDLYCFDADDGTPLWNRHVTDGNFECPVTYDDHRVYLGDGLKNGVETKYYYCYADNGTLLWKHANDNSSGFCWSGAAAVGNHIIYTTFEGNLTSLNRTTGKVAGIKSLKTDFTFSKSDAGCFRTSVVHHDGWLYVTSESGQTTGYCFKVKLNTDGTFADEGWSSPIGFSTSTPTVVDGRVYLGHGEHGNPGALICLNDADGRELWHVDTDAGVKSSPAVSVVDGKTLIYFTDAKNDGELYCVDGNGTLLWTFNPPDDTAYVLQGAAVSDDCVYFGTDAGYLYCIEGMEKPAAPSAYFTATPRTGSAPLNVSFTDCSTGYGITDWHWNFGDGSVSNESSPYHVFGEGTWTVKLTVTNAGGTDTCNRPSFIKVSENEADFIPVASFTATPSGTLSPVSVVFNDTSTNIPTSWFWDFGDNTTSTLQKPTHRYVRAGTYNVTLNATNQYGTGTTTQIGAVTVRAWNVPDWATNDSWPQFHKDEVHSGFSEGSAPSTNTRLWVSDDIHAITSTSVAVAGGRIFVNCNYRNTTTGKEQSRIRSLDQKTGAYLGAHGDGNAAYGSWSSPVYDDGNVWCGINDYPKNDSYIFSTVNAGTLVTNGKVFTSNWDGGQYFAFDEYTGEELWNFTIDDVNPAISGGSRAQSCPAYKDGRVYVTSWTDGGSSSGKAGHIYCLDADTGALIWKQNNLLLNTCGSPMIHDDTIYLTTYHFYGNGEIYALNISDGSIRWSNSSIMRTDSTPAYAYGNIYVCGGCDGYSKLITYCFNATTGAPVWQTNASDKIGSWTCSPAVADGKVYAGTSNGYTGSSGITCLDAYTGEILWKDAGGGGSPAIVDGVVYSVGNDGRVYAYASGSTFPTANFTATPISGDAPLTVTFTDSSVNATAWAWDFENDGTVDSTEQNATHTYTSPGTYSVNLTVSNAGVSNSKVKTDYITVTSGGGGESVLTAINVTPSIVTLLEGGSCTFNATALDQDGNRMTGIAFAWSVGDETVGTVDGNGTFTAHRTGSTTVTAACGTVTGTADVVVTEAGGAVVATSGYPMYACTPGRTGNSTASGPVASDLLWAANVSQCPDSTPVVADGRVYVATWQDMTGAADEKYLYCFDEWNGTEIWKNPLGTGTGAVSGMVVAGGTVYLGGTDGCLWAVNAATGTTEWHHQIADPTSSAPYGLSSAPLVYDGVVYENTAEGKLYAFAPDGTELWVLETGGSWDGAPGGTYFSSPAAEDGLIYFTGDLHEIWCVDAATHEKVWNTTTASTIIATPVVEDGSVYVRTNDHLLALNATSGAVLWNETYTGGSSTLLGTPVGSPALAYDRLYLGTTDGLRCYNASSGVELWHFASAKVEVTPVVAGDLVYIATNEAKGTVYAVYRENGTECWHYTLPNAGGTYWSAFFGSSPAVDSSMLFIGAETTNTLYAFGTAGEATTIQITPADATLTVAGSQQFTATALDIYGRAVQGVACTWSVDNTTVGMINTTGYFTASSAGTTNVTAAAGTLSGTAAVTVLPGGEVLWQGGVSLAPDENVTLTTTTGTTYQIGSDTAFGALLQSSRLGHFNVSFYDDGGRPIVQQIAGVENSNDMAWVISLNSTSTVDNIDVGAGDTVNYFYCPAGDIYGATAQVSIDIGIASKVCLSNLTVDNGTRGGSVVAHLDARALSGGAGWYVIVVSGTNTNGYGIASTATLRLDDSESVGDVPVIVTLPPEIQVGEYTLYAAVYPIDDYPGTPDSFTGGIACTVA